jgi:hypothetical protein
MAGYPNGKTILAEEAQGAIGMTVLETELLIVEVAEGRCIVTNKLRGHRAELKADYDGLFTLHMLVDLWQPPSE